MTQFLWLVKSLGQGEVLPLPSSGLSSMPPWDHLLGLARRLLSREGSWGALSVASSPLPTSSPISMCFLFPTFFC